MTRETSNAPFHTADQEFDGATPHTSEMRHTPDQLWLEASDRAFWLFLVPVLVLMLALVTATAFFVAHQGWVTMP